MPERKAVADVFKCMDKEKIVVVDEFDDRLKIQKTIYLLQEYGVDLGYTYSWYTKDEKLM